MKSLWHKLTGMTLDSFVPVSALYGYLFSKFFCVLRGFIKLGRLKVFVDKHCTFKCKRLIKTKPWLNIQRHVYIDALSRKGVNLGSHVSIGCFTRIECTDSLSHLGEGFTCGDPCGLGTNAFYGAAGGITLGNNIIVGNYVSFHSENHNFSDKDIPIRLQGVNHQGIVIGDNCWIGAKSTILDGVRIGNGCVIAAGAVVTKSFPDNVVIGGVPAKIIKNRISTKSEVLQND